MAELKMLADRVLRERPKQRQFEPLRADIIGPLGQSTCERYAFDDAASEMIGRMGAQLPDKMRALLNIARPACDHVWIEWNHGPARRAAVEAGVREFNDADSEYVRRMGVLVRRSETALAFAVAQENDPAQAISELMYWPLGYAVSTNGSPLPGTVGLSRTESNYLSQAAWGYSERSSLAPLRGLAMLGATPGAGVLRRIDAGTLDEAVQQAASDLLGSLRLVIAALAILNAVGEVGAVTRPPGVIRSGMDLKPYVPRALVTVQVPKHRTALSFARSRILAHHKRLHEVRSHWRHLGHEPQAPGWERVEIGGRTLWRKAIAKHLRGNPDLGVVEHAGARVTGPHAP